ncbi:hypothetical protein [Pseudomonas benzenivorans]|uniref:Uncharacterized protein n=1 Tax=Pseudomonas benzenivorans TaxID=556533 RepID=A0ABY5H336_9PSED|nr:hypothetical protein [Pseudomonas benzenivorans]UTW06717.1 hypothetical protein KDW96_16310 [Pseudomonas benzenivorans]
MKKITLLFAGLMASGVASAVELTGTGPVRMTDCALLNEDVSITLTTGVEAGVSCDADSIVISACHTAGRTTSRSANVTTCVNTDGDATTGVNGNEDCSTAPQAVAGPAMPTASTLAGTVISEYPAGACSAADAETYATSKL